MRQLVGAIRGRLWNITVNVDGLWKEKVHAADIAGVWSASNFDIAAQAIVDVRGAPRARTTRRARRGALPGRDERGDGPGDERVLPVEVLSEEVHVVLQPVQADELPVDRCHCSLRKGTLGTPPSRSNDLGERPREETAARPPCRASQPKGGGLDGHRVPFCRRRAVESARRDRRGQRHAPRRMFDGVARARHAEA